MREIESQAVAAEQQIGLVKAQTAGKQREAKMLGLTLHEVSSIPSGTRAYEGLGKMCDIIRALPQDG